MNRMAIISCLLLVWLLVSFASINYLTENKLLIFILGFFQGSETSCNKAKMIPMEMQSGIRGFIYQQKPDFKFGEKVCGAQISYISEDGSKTQTTVSDVNGAYQLALPPARYRVTVEHPDYDTYTTGGGFSVVRANKVGTANYFLRIKGVDYFTDRSKSSELLSAKVLKQADQPPSVEITVQPQKVKVGEIFTVTVKADDDNGLTSIWWFGDRTGDKALDKAHSQSGFNKQSITRSWQASASKPGEMVLTANARDNAYGKRLGEAHQASEGGGMASVKLIVVD